MEAQSFGVPLGFGGPYCPAFIATRENMCAKCRGACGQTVDKQGRRRICCDSGAREQHIAARRRRQISVPNQALVSTDGQYFYDRLRQGRLKELARQNCKDATLPAIRQAGQSSVRRCATLQRNSWSRPAKSLMPSTAACSAQDGRRLAIEKFFPELGKRGSMVLHGTDNAQRNSDTAVGLVAEKRALRAICQGESRRGGRETYHAQARSGNQNERLIFREIGWQSAYKLPALDVPGSTPQKLLGSSERKTACPR